ncbi:MAG: Flagellar P-ring protein [Phycisphaerae bacterium]|nr:Flagellar P-ring protein [Phycisphaerae bacterium]
MRTPPAHIHSAKRRAAVLPASLAAATLLFAPAAGAQVRVQDVATLQGQRTNRLLGIGLVVGLNGSGDTPKYASARRALMSLHRKFEQPVLTADDLRTANSAALVTVEADIPEFGAREGQTVDVVVSVLGDAKSIEGGQLLLTPLQDATLTIPDILALAGGRVDLPNPKNPKRGVIRAGATLEEHFLYTFIENDAITLVLNDTQAGFPMAHLVASAVNQELASPVAGGRPEGFGDSAAADQDFAVATGPKSVSVRIPDYELARPARFLSQVLQTELFVMPQQAARVVVNRTTKSIAVTGNVTISPTVLQIPGVGTVNVGGGNGAAGGGGSDVVALDTGKVGGVKLQDLMTSLAQLRLTGDQLITAIEQLHRTGTLHAQLLYTE